VNAAICPACHGTARQPYTGQHANIIAGYDAATGTIACNNCGGQTMYGTARGQVPLNRDGEPCLHKYEGVQAGNCYWKYTCVHGCGDTYSIGNYILNPLDTLEGVIYTISTG
jgi:hypothetical protein